MSAFRDIGPDEVFPGSTILDAATIRYQTGRRDTPTGTVIARLDPQADREKWLTLRRTGIGSSDMAAVLGMDSGTYARSELDVYMDKVGDGPEDDGAGEAAFWGNVLEDPVARVWAQRHDVQVQRIGTIAHVDRRHMICDLDRRVVGCPDHERCALEVKTRNQYTADQWKDGAIPDKIEAQVMQQLAVTGYDAVHVAALIGGQRLESRLVLPDPDYIADLFKVGDQFWFENVVPRVPPMISSLDLLVDHLSRLRPVKGVPVDLTDADVREVQHLTRIIVEAEQAAAAGAEAEAKIKALIGEDATDIIIDDVPWWTWRSQNKPKWLDVETLDAALAKLGSTLEDFKHPNGTTRSLRKGPPVKAMLEDAAPTD